MFLSKGLTPELTHTGHHGRGDRGTSPKYLLAMGGWDAGYIGSVPRRKARDVYSEVTERLCLPRLTTSPKPSDLLFG